MKLINKYKLIKILQDCTVEDRVSCSTVYDLIFKYGDDCHWDRKDEEWKLIKKGKEVCEIIREVEK